MATATLDRNYYGPGIMGPGQPRSALTGRWVCFSPFPRTRVSRCGCGGGGDHPCPIGERIRRLRGAGPRRPRGALEERSAMESELQDVELDLAGTEQALEYARQRIRDASGSLHHSANENRGYHASHITALDREGLHSEAGYNDLLLERRELRRHHQALLERRRHLRRWLRGGRRAAGRARDRLARRAWRR